MLRFLVVCVGIALLWSPSLSQVTTQTLYLDNAYHDAGEWGPIDLCAAGSFATAIEVKYKPPGNLDETAVNGVKLYCTDYITGIDTGYVTSSVGGHGEYWGMQICSDDFITGFRANVLEYQGIFTDDVAVENIDVDCNYGAEIVPGLPFAVPKIAKVPRRRHPVPINAEISGRARPAGLTHADTYDFQAGQWSSFATCREGLAVCGLQTRYEDASLGDETAICDIVFFCCDRPVTNSTTEA